MTAEPKLPRFRYFARSSRHAGAVLEIRAADGRLVDAEELVVAVSRVPVAAPGGPLRIGTVILATADTLAEVIDDVSLLGMRPPPRAKISRPTPGTADGGTAEAEARGRLEASALNGGSGVGSRRLGNRAAVFSLLDSESNGGAKFFRGTLRAPPVFSVRSENALTLWFAMAPAVGIEPTT